MYENVPVHCDVVFDVVDHLHQNGVVFSGVESGTWEFAVNGDDLLAST